MREQEKVLMDIINYNLPSIKQLQCFLAVAQELNFRKAAEKLQMTQPPLTRQIKCLEHILGHELFTRNTHKVHLTDVGKLLVVRAESIIKEIHFLTKEISASKMFLRIGLTRTLNFENIDLLYNTIKNLIPEENMAIQNMTSVQLLQCLRKNLMDIVFTGERHFEHEPDIQFHWVYREPLLLAMPSSHSGSLREKVDLGDVSDIPLFWFSRNANQKFFDKCEDYFKTLSFTLKRMKESDDSLITLSNVARGKGVALMPQSMCTFNKEGLCYRHLTDNAAQHLHIDVYVAIRKHEHREFVLTALKEILNVIS
jgi:DNA-binding transcriptional LysR family regulator